EKVDDLVHSSERRVAYEGRNLRFPHQTLGELRACVRRFEKLQRDALTGLVVDRRPHRAHATATEGAPDAVAAESFRRPKSHGFTPREKRGDRNVPTRAAC